ncbi:nuclear transport factor 2 family protein [Sulfitobacter sp. S190]|uniref:nuclear transport factor 2 family protein n=1 Tax=Sulfitobacter sp. S190 TaxID=2867022 RepID=UPI0021A50EE5|nr:nuclear transport factor 2 family protein [Sulfitobacter sp. S190]UWR22851.1 nuclear transport factor 2 family protein [Sulfitobacter sp. S190]
MTDTLRHTIETCERAVWEALVAGDPAADAAALHDSFLGVYPDGFAGKDAHVSQLHDGPGVDHYTLTDIRVRAMGADYALISYRATYRRRGREAEETMFVSSIWQRYPQGWRNIFSQDTPAH